MKQNRVESIRFVAAFGDAGATLDTEIDNIRSKLYRAGKGKLWTISAAADRRWCHARLGAVPGFRLEASSKFALPVALPFTAYSDWYNELQNTDAAFTMNEATETFSISNAGNARVYNAVFTLTGVFVNPRIENTTSGYVMQSTRDGTDATNSKLRFDAGSRRVEFSSDAGVTYSGDYSNFVRQVGQVHLMVLDPGTNNFSVSFGAVPTATLLIRFYPAWT